MIKAIRKNQSLIDDILHASKDEENFHIWWLGQSGLYLFSMRQYLSLKINAGFQRTYALATSKEGLLAIEA